MNKLETIGWDQSVQDIDEDKIARVIAVQKNSYRILDGEMEYFSHLSGKFLNQVVSSLDYPAVGDWVEVQKLVDEQKAVVNRILPRKSQFVRQAAGTRTEAQIVAANMDTVFIVNSLNHDLNLRRMERYILSTYESGATPVIILTKRDECAQDEIDTIIAQVEEVAIGVPIIPLSNITKEGIEELLTYLPAGKTGALLGSSGVGKSTLVNTLIGDKVQETKDVRTVDSRGRHTTTHREMFRLPNGSLLIDTPGMRELQLWEGETAIDATFQDVEVLENECKFTDCQHDTEPGCRVQEAIANGELSDERFKSYLKLQRELAYERRKQDQKAQLEEKNRWKKISKMQHTQSKFRKKR
ncbi:ribosome small subunit-dependent GTPase A [Virgibacillus necropolis]|uniref:Small ribosomal subunit biogenesis GTPase RsgA n=1 Tax=Virgibacillus necropolis TaxID=163877 RepID=A0A221MHS9_9BACI|nr:ribosome small subunit-dependent GTPase A [Virgibacillus necropolis]ASN07196.1 ribosome small subunit-dependent GTPase A [Virgibacillus necropolis]